MGTKVVPIAGKDIITEKILEAYSNGTEGGPRTMCDVLDRIESKGKEEGKEEGMNLLSALINKLIGLGRNDEILKVTNDTAYRDKLLAELVIK